MRIRRVIGYVIAAVVTLGLLAVVVIVLPWVDTFDDMNVQLERASVPRDFEWIAFDQGGLRSGFAAANPPFTERAYSAPWDGGRLCDRLERLARERNPAVKVPYGRTCTFSAEIPSGWAARAVNVWHYTLVYSGLEPEVVRRSVGDADCAAIRDKHDKAGYGRFGRFEPCWVPSGKALVYVTVQGKSGL
jgi:hypothetical protein